MHMRVEISGPGEPSRTSSFEGPSIMLGRDPACQLHFDGKVNSAVSWQHARIDLTQTGGSISDLGSSNGTFVNGGQVTSTKALQKGDVISLGQTGPRIRILDLAAAAVAPTVTEKLLPGGILTPPRGTVPLNVSISSDSLPPRPKKRRTPVAGIVLGLCALAAVAAAGYVVFTSQNANKTDTKNDAAEKDVAKDGAKDAVKDGVKDAAVDPAKDKTKIDVAVLPEIKDKTPPDLKDAKVDLKPIPITKTDPPEAKTEKLPTGSEIYRQTLKSTGWILVAKQLGQVGGGTGALVDPEKRLFLTAAHVTEGAKTIKVYFPKYENDVPLSERDHYVNKEIPVVADVVVSNRDNDLAVLRLRNVPEGVSPIAIAKTSVSAGNRIYTVGNPGASEALWSYTDGSVRQITKKALRDLKGPKAWVIVAQFPINPGDSGGPVVNERGELVGVNSSRELGAQLVSNCIDLREIRDVLDQAAKKGDE